MKQNAERRKKEKESENEIKKQELEEKVVKKSFKYQEEGIKEESNIRGNQ